MRFRELTNNDYEIRSISKKLNNGDFDYWLVIEVLHMTEYVPNPDFKYMVTLQAVSPDEAGSEQLKSALECFGVDDDIELTDWLKVSLLSESGIYAQLWNDGGDNLKQLLKEAHRQADISNIMFGLLSHALTRVSLCGVGRVSVVRSAYSFTPKMVLYSGSESLSSINSIYSLISQPSHMPSSFIASKSVSNSQ
ncbi:unnamed protein product [marine sediment metagenome]|uniref:Uncharacterized protein n=1 Tax=marine sediment metagenome TaxID=412755 RepID=X1B4Q2_9ZZZZ